MQLPDGLTKEKLLKTAMTRARVAGKYIQPYQEKAVRFYKIYRSIKDIPPDMTEEDLDEITVTLGYAFGLVEHGMGTVVEPMFQKRPPCLIKPKNAKNKTKAENFSGYARKLYAKSEFQLGYTRGSKECLIAGWNFERAGRANQYSEGKKWAINPLTNRYEEVSIQIPERVGFHNWFPSLFDVFPEPGVWDTKDMHYLLEQERNVVLDDLRKQFYEDPETGELVPVYDLTELDKDFKDHEPGQVTPTRIKDIFGYEFGDEVYDAITKHTKDGINQDGVRGDLDRVHVLHIHEPNKYWCILNGKYVVSYRENFRHRPRIPYLLKNYIQDNHSPFGIGMIEPVESLLNILDDTESLTLQQFYRLVNKMVAVREDAIVDYADFQPRAKGIVRIRQNHKASEAIYPWDHNDSTGEMLNHQSNARGMIEWVDGSPDLSPGTEGTKQTHKTASGLHEIQQNISKRMAIVRRQFLAVEQERIQMMLDDAQENIFDPVEAEIVDKNGSSRNENVGRDDLIAEEGYEICIESDPSLGDDTNQREFANFNFDIGLKYEEWRVSPQGLQQPAAPKANIPEAYRQVLRLTGYDDTSQMLLPNEGIMDPGQKFDMILKGAVIQPNIQEDLKGTILEFTKRMTSPEFMQAAQAGQIPPEVLQALNAHLEAAKMLMAEILKNPLQAVQVINQQEITGGQNV